jgi:hypothetical protein
MNYLKNVTRRRERTVHLYSRNASLCTKPVPIRLGKQFSPIPVCFMQNTHPLFFSYTISRDFAHYAYCFVSN